MRHTNPLTILFGSVIIFFIAIYSLNIAKKEKIEAKKEFIKYKNIATDFQSRYNKFSNKKSIKKSIEKILKSSNISNANILESKKIITIQIGSLNIRQIDKFINKFLNESFNIVKFEVAKSKIIIQIGVI